MYQHEKITKKSLQKFKEATIIMKENVIMEENIVVIRDPKTFHFSFDFPKDVDENLKREVEFIINSNEPLAENKIKK